MPKITRGDFTALHLAGIGGSYEPQRQHDFEITFSLEGIVAQASEPLSLAITSAFLPSESMEEIELPFLNERVFIAGKYSVESGTLSIKDMINAPSSSIMNEWFERVHHRQSGRTGFASDYKCEAVITMAGPGRTNGEPNLIRKWRVTGLWPQSVNWGTLDYSANDIVSIEATMRYDKCFVENNYLPVGGSGQTGLA